MSKKRPNMNIGAAGLFILFSLLFFILIYRFASIQITGEAVGQPLAAKAKQKYSSETVIDAVRGSIYDRNGEVIAEDIHSYTLVAILDEKMTTNPKQPNHVENPQKTAKALAQYLEMEESEIYRLLTKEDVFQVEFGKAGRNISHEIKTKIEEEKLPGITFTQDTKRFYPNGTFSSHLIGYVEKQEKEDGMTDSVGMLGVEAAFDEELTGKDGSLKVERDLWGFLLPNSEKEVYPAENGNDVYLTLDKKIQTFVEDAVGKVDEEYQPEKIIAVVADAKSGDILAMSQRPTFDPDTREGINDNWHNEVIETSIEPGSTMKIFTLAAAVEEKKFNPNEKYKSGTYKVTEKSSAIGDHNGRRGWGEITYLEGIQRSSNVAVAKLVNEKIGFDTYREYLTAFGFDQKTGIELPNEVTGRVLYDWPIEKITTSFGQGTTLTPIQLVQAATAIANDGKMMKPQIIDMIVDSNTGETLKQTEPEVVGSPISADTAKEVREVLETTITSENGTGKNYQIDGYEITGKTGTAQIPGKDGKYLTGHKNFLFSFLGMAPADDPELIVYVAVLKPEIDETTNGSVPVSEIFNPVMKSSLQYLNIEPVLPEKKEAVELSDFKGKNVANVESELKAAGMVPVVLGEGVTVADQSPGSGEALLEGEKVFLKTDGKLIAPDMTGWSLRDVMKFAQLSGLKLNKAGNGYVTKQNIQPGQELKEGEYLIIELSSMLEENGGDGEDGQESTEESGEEETEDVIE